VIECLGQVVEALPSSNFGLGLQTVFCGGANFLVYPDDLVEPGTHCDKHQVKIDRFGEIVVRTRHLALDHCQPVRQGREKDKGDIGDVTSSGAGRGQQFEPAHARHGDVAEDEVGALVGQNVQGHLSILGPDSAKTKVEQFLDDVLEKARLVLDAEDEEVFRGTERTRHG